MISFHSQRVLSAEVVMQMVHGNVLKRKRTPADAEE
jgi:hypothetical protein